MPVVSITRLRVRSWHYLPGFMWYALRSAWQSKGSHGNLATKILKERNKTFWTATLWADESVMRNFMLAPPHRIAMRKLLAWCDEAALVHWTQEHSELPDWITAHTRLHNEGRRSKVNHPSDAHIAYELASPRVGRIGELRLK